MYRHPLPVADAGNDVTINSGDSVQLGGAPTALGGSPGYSYLWFPAEEMVDGTVANPVAFPSQTTDFTVFAIDTNGCAGTDMVNVTVESAFTQNGFGKGNWEKGNISIYPNPATDRLAVDMQLDNHRSLEPVS